MYKRRKDKYAASGKQFDRLELLRDKWKNHPDDNAAKELIESYRAILDEFSRTWTNGEDYDDLYQTASESLLEAVKQFDPSRKAKFETFAKLVIGSAIKDYVHKYRFQIKVSRQTREDLHRLKEAASEFEQQHERTPTVTELVAVTALTEKRIRKVRQFEGVANLRSLNESQDLNDADWEYLSRLESQSEAKIKSLEWKLAVDPLLNSLEEWPRQVLKLRFGFSGDGMTQEAIAKLFGKSQQAIQKAESVGLKALRSNPESRILAEYLLGRLRDALPEGAGGDVPHGGRTQGQTIKKILFIYTLQGVRRNHEALVIKKLLMARLKGLPKWMHKAFVDAYGRASAGEASIWIIENLLSMRFLRRAYGNRELKLTAEGAEWLERSAGKQVEP
jgi:RNA polymerase sigma factor (sigma-70 family)